MTPDTTLSVSNGHHSNGVSHAKSAAENGWQIVQLDVKSIEASPFQPRENFDDAELEELAQSIKAYGVQQPILVRPLETEGTKPHFELVAGERRWRASQIAGRKTIPALVREMSDLAAAEIAVIENVQRANLSIIEEARGYKQLALKFRLKEERIAKKVGKSVQTIREMLRLLALPESVQTLLAKRQLTATHGHELLRLASQPQICEAVANRAVRDKITATSLVSNILPNAVELKRAGLITELGYGTRFDWRTLCKECPHKALVSTGYQSFCLRPDEWKRKQDAAIEIQQQEAARVMEEARQQNEGTVESDKLSQIRHRRLLGVQLPAGCCETCECRSETFDDADPTRRVPICLNPERFDDLRDAERKSHEEARRVRYTQDWKDAVSKLRAEGDDASQIAALTVWPILRGDHRGYVAPDVWQNFVAAIAAEMRISLDLDKLLDRNLDHFDGLKKLREVPPSQLWLLGAGLLLGQEAERAIRFTGQTPQLDFVLGREKLVQTEMADESTDEDDFSYDDEDNESADYDEIAETEAEVEEDYSEMSEVEVVSS